MSFVIGYVGLLLSILVLGFIFVKVQLVLAKCGHHHTCGGCYTDIDKHGNSTTTGKLRCVDCGVVIMDFGRDGPEAKVDWSVYK